MIGLTDEQLIQELKDRFTENKQSLEELRKLTKQLKEVNIKLEESEALKSHFISNITNEIVNPFTSIIGLSKSILKLNGSQWPKVQNMVQLIASEAFNLDFQLKNIFAAAKIEAGEIAPEIVKTNITSIIESVIDNFTIEAEKKNIKIKYTGQAGDKTANHFNTDPEKFKLIISNLLNNALNFSYKENSIDIGTSIDNGVLYVTVKDYGAGISEEDQEKIYDRFKRLDNGINSINRGHGLGLSITKAYLDLLKGKIEVFSAVGKGAAFTISLTENPEQIEGYATDDNEFIFDNSEIF
ncbi:MAG: HAMP domain-containing histidine kinase [Bacteroidales bacterium]|nr:HAMP domain-containing histidine kinase [Bacteroidales bacterium]